MRSLPTYTGWNKKGKQILLFSVLVILAGFLLALNICIGSVTISFSDVLRSLVGEGGQAVSRNIIRYIRFPRAVAAAVLGGALALAGYLLQTFFHNPLAGPFVLGISSGAKLMVALALVFGISRAWKMSSFFLILAAFAGAVLSMGFVMLLSGKLHQTATLVVSGVMIGYICSAVTDLVVTFAEDSDIVNLHNWSRGSFSGITWENVAVMSFLVGVTAIVVLFLSKPIAAYRLGETYAESMGVNIRLFRLLLVLLSGILSACVTAFAGPVSFVGIAVPQIMKRIFSTTRPLVMIPAAFLGGAIWCLFCDLLARTLFAPTELSISTVTAVFGVPVVIYVMLQGSKRRAAGL